MKKIRGIYSYKSLIKAVLPSIFTMVFLSAYSIVDGFFVSNFVGKTAFAAVNLVMPLIMGIAAIGFMLGAGGSALVAKTLGEGDGVKANKLFSMVVYFNLILGVLFSVLGAVFIKPISIFLGATENMLGDCVTYGTILLSAEFLFMTQNVFQNFFVAAGKAKLGFLTTVSAGVTNMVLDAVLVGALRLGLVGAAAATVIGYGVGSIIPAVYFSVKNGSALRLTLARLQLKPLIKSCTNGSSEFLTNVSQSIVGMLFNMQLLKFAGEDGVAAYGIIMYVGFVFMAVFFGYALGVAPIVSYQFGAKNTTELKNLLVKSLVINASIGIFMLVITESLARPLSMIFANYDKDLLELTVNALRLYGIAYLIAGFNVFGSAYFTALNDGLVSAVISVGRTLVLQVATVLIMPIFFGLNGVWLSVAVAEALALIITGACFIIKRKKYNYI